MISYPVSAGRITTRVIEQGHGDTTLVLVHGVGARADRWVPFLQQLPPGVRGVAVYFPGHGFATKGRGPGYSVPSFAEFLIEFLKVLDVAKPVAVGTSLGGHVVAAAEVRHPGTFASLILVGATGIVPIGAEVRRTIAARLVDHRGGGYRRQAPLGDSRPAPGYRGVDRGGIPRQQLGRCRRVVRRPRRLLRARDRRRCRRSRAEGADRDTARDRCAPDLGCGGHSRADRNRPRSVSRASAGCRSTWSWGLVHAPYFEDPGVFTDRVGEALGWSRGADPGSTERG